MRISPRKTIKIRPFDSLLARLYFLQSFSRIRLIGYCFFRNKISKTSSPPPFPFLPHKAFVHLAQAALFTLNSIQDLRNSVVILQIFLFSSLYNSTFEKEIRIRGKKNVFAKILEIPQSVRVKFVIYGFENLQK